MTPIRVDDIPDAELEVLKALWETGPATVREVMNHLHKHGRQPAYTTVLTLLTRLESRRMVSSDKSAQAYVYKPAVSRDRVVRGRLRTMIEQLYDGAAVPLVLHLMKTEKFTSGEIAELQKLIDRLDRDSERP